MKHRFTLLAAALLGLGVAHHIAPAPTPVAEQRPASADSATGLVPKQAPAPAVANAPARPAATKRALRLALELPRYAQKPGPRRVKYGRSRWVVLA